MSVRNLAIMMASVGARVERSNRKRYSMILHDEGITSALEKLRRFSLARNRSTDKEVRTFTLTDDEGLALCLHIELLEALDDSE